MCSSVVGDRLGSLQLRQAAFTLVAHARTGWLSPFLICALVGHLGSRFAHSRAHGTLAALPEALQPPGRVAARHRSLQRSRLCLPPAAKTAGTDIHKQKCRLAVSFQGLWNTAWSQVCARAAARSSPACATHSLEPSAPCSCCAACHSLRLFQPAAVAIKGGDGWDSGPPHHHSLSMECIALL